MKRRCPLCDGLTDEPVCPRDRMATLLVSAPPSQAPLPQPGMVIAGRYELEGLIGRGGHGQIFAARHLGTGQRVALKILLAPAESDEDFAIKRFFLEARVTSGLTHPNTVRVFDFGQEDSGLVFLALELLSGMTLRQALKVKKAEGRVFTEREAVDVAVAITRSLAEAHAAGLVHRDLKPDNIFLHQVAGDEPIVKVLDFGIAKLGSGLATLSTPTSVPGTPAYMSPEQALTGDVDARSDLYGLGVILFQLVTGELPFRGPSDPQTLYMHAYQAPPDLRALAKTAVSDAYVAVVMRALEKDRARRFADAREMREALQAVLLGREVSSRPPEPAAARVMTRALDAELGPTPLSTARVPIRRGPDAGRLGVAGLLVAAVVGGALLGVYYFERARPSAPEVAKGTLTATTTAPATTPVRPEPKAEPEVVERKVREPEKDAAAKTEPSPKAAEKARAREVKKPKGTSKPDILNQRLEDLVAH